MRTAELSGSGRKGGSSGKIWRNQAEHEDGRHIYFWHRRFVRLDKANVDVLSESKLSQPNLNAYNHYTTIQRLFAELTEGPLHRSSRCCRPTWRIKAGTKAVKEVLELCVGNKGKRHTTHDDGQQQKALQNFVLRPAQLVADS